MDRTTLPPRQRGHEGRHFEAHKLPGRPAAAGGPRVNRDHLDDEELLALIQRSEEE